MRVTDSASSHPGCVPFTIPPRARGVRVLASVGPAERGPPSWPGWCREPVAASWTPDCSCVSPFLSG